MVRVLIASADCWVFFSAVSWRNSTAASVPRANSATSSAYSTIVAPRSGRSRRIAYSTNRTGLPRIAADQVVTSFTPPGKSATTVTQQPVGESSSQS